MMQDKLPAGWRHLASKEPLREGDEMMDSTARSFQRIDAIAARSIGCLEHIPVRRKVRPAPDTVERTAVHGWRCVDGGEPLTLDCVRAEVPHTQPTPDTIGQRATDDEAWLTQWPEDPRLARRVAPSPRLASPLAQPGLDRAAQHRDDYLRMVESLKVDGGRTAIPLEARATVAGIMKPCFEPGCILRANHVGQHRIFTIDEVIRVENLHLQEELQKRTEKRNTLTADLVEARAEIAKLKSLCETHEADAERYSHIAANAMDERNKQQARADKAEADAVFYAKTACEFRDAARAAKPMPMTEEDCALAERRCDDVKRIKCLSFLPPGLEKLTPSPIREVPGPDGSGDDVAPDAEPQGILRRPR